MVDAAPANARDVVQHYAETRNLVLQVGDRRLIDDITLRLSADPVTVIMGPNGAGKSLLLRLLHGLLKASAGEILWRGKPLTESDRLRQAMVFQRPVLLRRSVAANIDFVLKLRGNAEPGRTARILERVRLADVARQPARLLSGGEQQRLALARALATEPEVLFLDEPTASLDPASTQLIEHAVLEAHARGTRVVYVTHDIGQAKRLAGDIVFMHRGRVMEHAEAKGFFAEPSSHVAREYLAGKIVL